VLIVHRLGFTFFSCLKNVFASVVIHDRVELMSLISTPSLIVQCHDLFEGVIPLKQKFRVVRCLGQLPYSSSIPANTKRNRCAPFQSSRPDSWFFWQRCLSAT